MDRASFDQVPRGPRRPVRLTASVERADGTTATAQVTEFSYLGCRLHCDHAFVKGETIRLFLPDRGQVHAQIRWIRGSQAGVKFLMGDNVADARRARIGV